MKTPLKYRAFVIGTISLCMLASTNRADDRLNSYQVKTMVEQGDIVSMDYLQERYPELLEGRWLDIELEKEDSGWVYEFEIIDNQGEVTEIKFNAANGEVIGIEVDD